MAIEEQMTVTVAEVEVNDEYRVELHQVRRRVDYSPEQAEALAGELQAAARASRRMLAEQLATMAQRAESSQPLMIDGEAVL